MKQKMLSFFSLFTSASTLLCCALPALLVTLGLGPVLASVIGVFPQITVLSEYKFSVFSVSLVFLILGGVALWQSQKKTCPLEQKENCKTTRDWSRPLYFISVGLWCIGFFSAFILSKIL